MKRKGIILAGGKGTRLYPITLAMSKQLMPIYDKPMIYYPLTTLMLANIRDILIISCPRFINNFKNLLGDGSQYGINLSYECQEKPEGIAQSFLIAEQFLNNSPCVLILGDNLFHGVGLSKILEIASGNKNGATIFASQVKDPKRYGVVEFSKDGIAIGIQEKPIKPQSKYAVTGLYFYDEKVVDYAKNLSPSNRGELEITCLNEIYLKKNNLKVEVLGRGISWFDTGTFESLHEASSYIKALDIRSGLKIGCPEEVSWRKNWITSSELEFLAKSLKKSGYGEYLMSLLQDAKN